MYDVHVLVVGGGLVGLTTAVALRHQGVECLVAERHPGTSPQPKARRFTFRSMEAFRSWDAADAVLAAAAGLADHQGMAAGRTLADAELLPVPAWQTGVAPDELSPEISCLVAQDSLEPVLRDLAVARGAEVRMSTAVTGFTQDDDGGVTATLAGGDVVRARYLVGADGAGSTVRAALGIGRDGQGTLGRAVTVYFSAGLDDVLGDLRFNLCQVDHPDAAGAFASIDGRRRWIYYTGPRDGGTDWAAVVRTAIGADVPVEVLSVLEWEPTIRVAAGLVRGRVLLAGDAARVMPPFAAMGANTGIGDVAGLAWRLGALVRGEGGAGLLAGYEAERLPAGRFAAEQSALRSGDLRELSVAEHDVHPLALVAGYGYPGGDFVDDGTPPAPLDRWAPSGRPGSRLPHVRLADGRSTLDLAGLGPVLLAAVPVPGVAVPAHVVPAEVLGAAAVLLRPDGIVGARWPEPPGAAEVAAALNVVLARRPASRSGSLPG